MPHGQEARIADFLSERDGPEMIIRYNGHDTGAMLVSNDGQILRKFNLNHSPNHTGMEVVYWNDPHDGTDVGLWRLVPFYVVEKREALGNKEDGDLDLRGVL